jgi:hypothetical protein
MSKVKIPPPWRQKYEATISGISIVVGSIMGWPSSDDLEDEFAKRLEPMTNGRTD